MNTLKEFWEDFQPIIIILAVIALFVIAFAIGYKNDYSCPKCEYCYHPTDNYCAKCGRQLRLP